MNDLTVGILIGFCIGMVCMVVLTLIFIHFKIEKIVNEIKNECDGEEFSKHLMAKQCVKMNECELYDLGELSLAPHAPKSETKEEEKNAPLPYGRMSTGELAQLAIAKERELGVENGRKG